MIKLLRHLAFKNSNWKQYNLMYLRQILVHDAPLIDVFGNDISNLLGISYLSQCFEQDEKIKSKLQYKGSIIGNNPPTLLPPTLPLNPNFISSFQQIPQLPYLLDTSSPFTTLSHRTLCSLHLRMYTSQITFSRQDYQIGRKKINIPANPEPKDRNSSPDSANMNILGMDFLTKFKEFSITSRNIDKFFDLKLSQ